MITRKSDDLKSPGKHIFTEAQGEFFAFCLAGLNPPTAVGFDWTTALNSSNESCKHLAKNSGSGTISQHPTREIYIHKYILS